MNYELKTSVGIVEAAVSRSIDFRSVVRLGMLTPSSNTVLEPLTAALLADLPHVTAHFARLRVTEITTDPGALAQFDLEPMLAAASMLVDARPHAIVWNGTSGGWRGLDADRRIVAALAERSGLGVSTVTLALVGLMRKLGIEKAAFVTPYTDQVQAKILANFRAEGFACTTSPCLGISENFAFSIVDEATIAGMIRAVADLRPDVILVLCTNLRAAQLVDGLEREMGVPIIDSLAAAVWGALRIAGFPAERIGGWGKLFANGRAAV
jgi:maleate isomerase